MNNISADEFEALRSMFKHHYDGNGHYDHDDIAKEDVPPGEEGWTIDKPPSTWGERIFCSLFAKGLVRDSGLRRRGERSGLYQIVFFLTDEAVERYGPQFAANNTDKEE